MSTPPPTDRSLTVMQVLPALEQGGVERGTLEVSQELRRRGHRSVVVSAGGHLVERLVEDGTTHLSLDVGKKRPWTLLKAFALCREILEHSVDLVHVRSRMPAWVTLAAWRMIPSTKRPRLVTTVHGLNSVNRYSRVMTRGEQVIAVSETCRQYVLDNYPDVDPKRMTVIHRGVDGAQFPYGYYPSSTWIDNWYREYPQLQEPFVAVISGRITRFKGHLDFIEAVDRTLNLGVPVHGLIVGAEDPRRKKYAISLREEIARRGLQSHITFTGHRDDIRDVISVADVVVSTSADPPESFGRAVLESVRLGRPTLGYDHGGVGEVLAEVYPEGRVPLHDTAEMAAKMAEVYHGELSPPAQTKAFDLQTLLRAEVDLYEKMVHGPGALRRAA